MGGRAIEDGPSPHRAPHLARRRASASPPLLPPDAWPRTAPARTDVYLVSFPKCGRTWLRVMIGRAFQLHFGLPADADLVELHRLAELDPRVPCVVATHDDDAQWKPPEDVEADKSRYHAQAGDPARCATRVTSSSRCTTSAAAATAATRARWRSSSTSGSAGSSRCCASTTRGPTNVDAPPDVLVVRYEDLHARPEDELRRVPDLRRGGRRPAGGRRRRRRVRLVRPHARARGGGGVRLREAASGTPRRPRHLQDAARQGRRPPRRADRASRSPGSTGCSPASRASRFGYTAAPTPRPRGIP